MLPASAAHRESCTGSYATTAAPTTMLPAGAAHREGLVDERTKY